MVQLQREQADIERKKAEASSFSQPGKNTTAVKEIMAQKKCTFKEGLEWYNVHVEELKATEIKA